MSLHYNFQPEPHPSGRGYTCADYSGRATWAKGPGRSCGWYKRKSDAVERCRALNGSEIQGQVLRNGRWEPVTFASEEEYREYLETA